MRTNAGVLLFKWIAAKKDILSISSPQVVFGVPGAGFKRLLSPIPYDF